MVYTLGITFDGKLFSLKSLQAKSKVQTGVLDKLLFADDMAEYASTQERMQKNKWIKSPNHMTTTTLRSALRKRK